MSASEHGDDGRGVPGPRLGGTLAALLETLPQRGTLDWIGLRPARRAPLDVVAEAVLDPACGLVGDRYAGRSGTRQVTLLQREHLPVIASVLGRHAVSAQTLRRNLVVGGINLLALKGRRFRVGRALLEHSGTCHPCSRMEEALGAGGYNALRGHGGITARVLIGGTVRVGDAVRVGD